MKIKLLRNLQTGTIHKFKQYGQFLGPVDICTPFPLSFCGYYGVSLDAKWIQELDDQVFIGDESEVTCGRCKRLNLRVLPGKN